ncbi:MAG: DUF1858 domain-containing protein [Nitrospinota bacterium]|nr:DUF1858 domain-containing protein [Nitrospinota bacterium]
MEIWAKRFTKMALIYLALGVVMGMVIGSQPEWSQRLRFVHIHLNLLGFMTMFIAGVAYHVLPRFNARPVPWPDGVKYHFLLHNTGLLGMATTHLAGGLWSGGLLHVAFVMFAVMTGAGLLIMAYNLYSVMIPVKEGTEVKEITGGMKVGDVLDQFPASLQIFIDAGFHSLSNPVARKAFASVVTIQKACEKHEVELGGFLKQLNSALFSKSGRPGQSGKPPAQASDGKEEAPVGVAMGKGKPCTRDTMVGSLIKIHPETKTVFEKHYGEGCFSCPGQVYETVEQTAHMHNIDPELILKEINAMIGK